MFCNKGNVVKLDLEDQWVLDKYRLYTCKKCVYIHEGKKGVLLSRIIYPDNTTRKVLHENRDSFDFRKSNLFCGNTYREVENYLIGRCFGGKEFKIDKEDFDLIKEFVWHVDKNGYVITKHNGRIIKQHRLIMGVVDDEGIEIDHIFHDTTDNRKSKLRYADRSLNCFNRRVGKSNKSGVVGVYWMSSMNQWAAQIRFQKKTHYLGTFNTIEEAAKARAEAVSKLNIAV